MTYPIICIKYVSVCTAYDSFVNFIGRNISILGKHNCVIGMEHINSSFSIPSSWMEQIRFRGKLM